MSKKFIPQQGGHPIKNDDFLIIQDRLLEFMKALGNPYGGSIADGFILSGCEISSDQSNYNITEGYILYDGEILSVPAQSLPLGAQAYWWELQTSTEQPRIYQDGQTRDVVENRIAVVVSGSAAPSPSMPMNAPRFEDLVLLPATNRLNAIEAEWLDYVPTSFEISSGGVFTLGTDPDKVKFKYKIIGKTMILNFAFEGDINQNAGYIRFGFPPNIALVEDFSLTTACYIGSSEGFNIERMKVNVLNTQFVEIIGNIGSASGVEFSGQFTAEIQ